MNEASSQQAHPRTLIEDIGVLVEEEGLRQLDHVDLRRSPSGVADAVLILTERLRPDQGRALEARLLTSGLVESVRLQTERVTIRFLDSKIAELAQHIPDRLSDLHGLGELLAGQTYIVDFCDPNATKALHVGHLRNLAIGHAIASLLRTAGANVSQQSVICDIGRNVCEAVAGYIHFGNGSDPVASGERGDVFIGRLYSEYVMASGGRTDDEMSPDVPILRELTVGGDLADSILSRWLAADPQIRLIWRQVVDWVLDGQRTSLDRLGIVFDTLIFESDSLKEVTPWVEAAMARGIVKRLPDGAVAYPTGRSDYQHLLLIRTDGFPTEHMRALPIWERLQKVGNDISSCIHVMGREWLPSTQIREEVLRRLGPCPLFDRYHKTAHGMVTLHGSKMKSSTGEALLIDEMIDRIVSEPRVQSLALPAGIDPGTLARVVVLGSFLAMSVEEDIEFSWPWLVDERRNPGMLLATAWSRAEAANHRPDHQHSLTPQLRYAVLQSERLKGFAERALGVYDTEQFVRFLARTGQWYVSQETDGCVSLVMKHLLRTGLAAVGLTGSDRLRRMDADTLPLNPELGMMSRLDLP